MIINGTLQEIFDKVCTHLNRQGHRAGKEENGRFRCKYSAPNGDMCAVGCLIPFEQYRPSIEGKPVTDLKIKALCGVISLLSSLQTAHDEAVHWEYLKYELLGIGKGYGLDLTTVNSLPFTPH